MFEIHIHNTPFLSFSHNYSRI